MLIECGHGGLCAGEARASSTTTESRAQRLLLLLAYRRSIFNLSPSIHPIRDLSYPRVKDQDSDLIPSIGFHRAFVLAVARGRARGRRLCRAVLGGAGCGAAAVPALPAGRQRTRPSHPPRRPPGAMSHSVPNRPLTPALLSLYFSCSRFPVRVSTPFPTTTTATESLLSSDRTVRVRASSAPSSAALP